MDHLSNVYDIYRWRPLPLTDLTCIEIAVILWRREIQQHITQDGILRERYPQKKTSLECLIPEIPPTILLKIETVVVRLSWRIPKWLSHHSKAGILNLDVLNHFCDFVCDFDGSIHYGRTAKRFVVCDGISQYVRFKMACFYCLEDDILRIWPEVSSRMTTNQIDFQDQPKLYYWVFRLNNQPHQVVFDINTSSMEEHMLNNIYENYSESEWPSIEYFLNQLPWERRMRHFRRLELRFNDTFFRHIVSKLNEAELKRLITRHTDVYVSIFPHWAEYVIHIWPHIKNYLTKGAFCRLVKFILKEQTRNGSSKDHTTHWRELWTSAPDRLKRAAIQDVLLVIDSSYFDRDNEDITASVGDRRSISLLLAILSDTPIEDRRTFWNKHWQTLLLDMKPFDLYFLMDLCFGNDQNQMDRFKMDVICEGNEMIILQLREFLEYGFMEELEQVLTFWCPNKETIKQLRLKLLLENFAISADLVRNASLFNEFIDNAFEDNDRATEFKNQLLVIPDLNVIPSLKQCIFSCDFRHIVEFLDTFAPCEEIVVEMKKLHIVPSLKAMLFLPRYFDMCLKKNFEGFENFVTSWLFKDCEEIVQFRETLDVDTIIQDFIRDKTQSVDNSVKFSGVDEDWFSGCFRTTKMPDSVVSKFLRWYFVTPEDVEMFQKKYGNDPMFNRLLL